MNSMKRFLVCLLTVEGVVSSTTTSTSASTSATTSASPPTRGGIRTPRQTTEQEQAQGQSHRRTAVSLIDATSSFQRSTESTYDHMVELYAEGDTHKLTYHWNDIRDNTFEGRVIHVTNSEDTAPSWLGFGIYDTFLHTAPVTSSTPFMVGSDAVIGIVQSRSVELYRLGAKEVNMDKDDNGNALGVQPATSQNLLNTNIQQHVSDDGTITTDLTFQKLVSDGIDVKVRHAGDNVFLWAMGPPSVSDFQTHGPDHRGVFKLDLDKVQQMAQAGQTGGTQEQDQQDKFENNDANQETTDGGTGDADADAGTNTGGGDAGTDETSSSSNTKKEQNTSPVVTGSCQSTNPTYEKMVALTPTLSFFWTLHPEDNKINVLLEYTGGEAWLGLGFSQTGKMIGSTAVIGIPGNAAEGQVQKYKLNDKSSESVNPLESGQQTLTDARISVTDDGVTSLQFTKLLDEGPSTDEVYLATKGLNTLLFAVGTNGDTLDYHAHRGTFRLDLGSCSAVIGKSGSSTGSATHMGAWATHGTFAVLAWAIASPFAMTVAWFRTLVPSSWIYVHVFSNVVSFTFSLIAVIIAFASMSYQTHPSHFSEPHHWVGLVLIVAMTFQVMNGFLRPPVEKRDPYSNAPNYQGGNGGGGGGGAGGNGGGGGAGGVDDPQAFFKIPRTPREIWFSSHRLTGIAMLGMGVYQIQSGLNLFARNFNVESMVVWYWVYVTLFGSGLISLKLWIRYEEYKARRGMETLSASPNGSDPQDTDALPVQFDAR